MTDSAINTIINEHYPAHGVENDSQVFRDNFENIKLNLNRVKSEISQFLLHGIRTDTPESNINDNIIENCTLRAVSEIRHDIAGLNITDFTVNHANGSYQSAAIGSDLTINISGFPPDTPKNKKTGKLRLHLSAESAGFNVTFASATDNIKYYSNFPFAADVKLHVHGSASRNLTVVDIWQVNSGTTPVIHIKYIGYFSELLV